MQKAQHLNALPTIHFKSKQFPQKMSAIVTLFNAMTQKYEKISKTYNMKHDKNAKSQEWREPCNISIFLIHKLQSNNRGKPSVMEIKSMIMASKLRSAKYEQKKRCNTIEHLHIRILDGRKKED